MKIVHITYCWLSLVLSALSAHAVNASLSIPEFSLHAGETMEVPICFQTDNGLCTFQFDLVLPEGVSLITNDGGSAPEEYITLSSLRSDHVAAGSLLSDGKVRFLVYSLTNTAYKDNEGELGRIKIQATDNLPPQTYNLTIEGIVLVTPSLETSEPPAVNCPFSVKKACMLTLGNLQNGTVTGIDNDTYDAGTAITLTAIPDEGYDFIEWWDGTTENPYEYTIEDNVEISANFAPHVYTVSYVIDGETVHTDNVAYGALLPEPFTPEEKDGYVFGGWSEIPDYMPAHDVTVTGTYTMITSIRLQESHNKRTADVYDLYGQLIRKDANLLDLKLPAGIYIINKRKVTVTD